MGEWSGHMWGSGMRFASLMMIGFCTICFGLVTFIRRIVKLVLPPQIPITKSVLGILNEYFAKGEIEKEEYEERKKVLLSYVEGFLVLNFKNCTNILTQKRLDYYE